MNGVKYHRLLSGTKIATLAEITGLSVGTVKNMQRPNKANRVSASSYSKVANVLNVPIDELLKEGYPESGVGVHIRALYPSRTGNVRNHIFIYRKEKNMSCQQLADILGLTSRERARQLCSTKVSAKKHLETLAKREGLSIEEFKRKYSQEN